VARAARSLAPADPALPRAQVRLADFGPEPGCEECPPDGPRALLQPFTAEAWEAVLDAHTAARLATRDGHVQREKLQILSPGVRALVAAAIRAGSARDPGAPSDWPWHEEDAEAHQERLLVAHAARTCGRVRLEGTFSAGKTELAALLRAASTHAAIARSACGAQAQL